MSKIKERDKQYVLGTYSRFDVEIVSGSGSCAVDSNGKKYIDMGSGIAVNTFGYADKEWAAAVTNQILRLQHTSNLYYTEPCGELAELLCKKTGAKKVFFSNSGAEANECAIKTARKYAESRGVKDGKIITLRHSFHGRTMGTLAATGQEAFHKDFLPLCGGFLYAEPGDSEGLKKLAETENVIAVMFECIQGEGGVLPLEKEYVKDMERLAREKDILLIADEVQCGNGRSGAMYAYMNYGITPDIVTTAKGLGGGLPIGATLFFDKTQDVLKPGDHGSTFGGNPAACAGAISIVSRLDERLFDAVKRKSDYIFAGLSGAEGVKSVSGMGLMIGIETERDAGEVVKDCIKNGVLVLKAKNKVRLLPPLNISDKELEKAVEVIKSCTAVKS